MLVLKFFRFLFGYVSFSAESGFSERFINLCRLYKINLWNLKSENRVITACTDCAGYRRIRRAAKKSGMRVRISKKHGLPFFINRHSRRIGIIPGICLCIAVICILSTRIWSVDVIGNERVSSEEITAVFEALGVRKGVPSGRIDIKSVEIEALKMLPEISWLNMNVNASTAKIEVRERNKVSVGSDDSSPSDIVAARDGQIVILRPFNGTQEQKIGNAVLKGDLLISGIEENKDLTVSFCKAQGYVVARTNRKIDFVQKNTFKVRKAAKKKKSYILDFLVFSIPLGKVSESSYKEKKELIINGVTLPLSITECTEITFEEKEITLSPSQTEQLAYLGFFEKCTEDFRYLKTKQAKISAKEVNGNFAVSGEFVCLENIGEEKPMIIVEEQ